MLAQDRRSGKRRRDCQAPTRLPFISCIFAAYLEKFSSMSVLAWHVYRRGSVAAINVLSLDIVLPLLTVTPETG